MAFDVNLGCSGFVYGLGLARSLILSGQASHVLLLTADTYSKYIHPGDKSVRTLFGDAAAATLVSNCPDLGPLGFALNYSAQLGTDESGGRNLIIPNGGFRSVYDPEALIVSDATGTRSAIHLYMNGPEIFNFTLKRVPEVIYKALMKAGSSLDEMDLVIMHQANRYMLEHLRKKLRLPEQKVPICMEECGNTVSSTIPLALTQCDQGHLSQSKHVLLVGFGVGYSWGAIVMERMRYPKDLPS